MCVVCVFFEKIVRITIYLFSERIFNDFWYKPLYVPASSETFSFVSVSKHEQTHTHTSINGTSNTWKFWREMKEMPLLSHA